MKKFTRYRLILVVLMFVLTNGIVFAQNDNYAVMEVVEVEFNSEEEYNNPYMDVDVWIELKKTDSPSETYTIPVFWDGGTIFRGRLVATSPGDWTWNIINATVDNSDKGFIDKSGSFTATPADVSTNPNNRGFIKVAANNRTLAYSDGTPYFFTADTSWSALTGVFGFDEANSITEISFKDYILARKDQGFNGLNVIASFPDDSYLEQLGRNLDRPGTETGLWASETWGKKVGASGVSPFEMKKPGQPVTDSPLEVDYKRITPEYWQSVDERMQFLSDEGFVTLFESVRRHERWAFRAQDEKTAFYNYIRYLWARYGCYNMIFSWVHHDSQGSIYPEWRELVQIAHDGLSEVLGNQMPYGQPRTAMSFNTSLNNWERDIPDALDIQNVSNAERDETMHEWLRDIYFSDNSTKPALNLEPFYPGWGLHSSNEINPGLDDITMAQMQMYGSVLSGGLAGFAWGDTWYSGAAVSSGRTQEDGGTLVPNNDPQVNALTSFESQAMGHLKTFILDAEHEYVRLIPAAHTNLSDSEGFIHTLSISDDKKFALGFFTADARPDANPLPMLTNLTPSETYRFEWWDVTNGGWISLENITTTDAGTLETPELPENDRTKSWAYRIRTLDYIIEDTATEDEPTTDEEPMEDFALRINCGGDAGIFAGETFIADVFADTGDILNRPQTGLTEPFSTFRYSPSQEMGYDIPLEDGEYTVRLHFAELWFGATNGGVGGVGSRVFDVRIEDALVEDNLDIFDQVGANTFLTKTHTIQITDGELNIDFSSLEAVDGTGHPVINAIEILNIEVAPPTEDETPEMDDLIGHWPLDETEGVYANEIASQEYTGALENGLTFENDNSIGQIEGALSFDGLNDWISLPDIDNDLQTEFSVSTWINPSNAEGGYQGVFGSSTVGGFMMFIRQGKLLFKVTTNENGAKLRSGGTIQNNIWQMITCTYDGSYMHMYVNGEKVHSEALTGTLKDKNGASIGWSGWGAEFFEGSIDDARLFDNALTEEQIVAMFEAGNGNAILTNVNENTTPLIDDGIVMEAITEYPNPTSGMITVTGLSRGMQLALFDFSSVNVETSTVTINGDVQMDLSIYPKGIYILQISHKAEIVARKIVLE